MPLHLVGENIDKLRAHRQAQAGVLIQLMRGIYLDADDDIDTSVIKHAVRIAKYLYPNAYLSAASAIHLAPTPDGRLYLSGRRVQRTRLRALEIIQNKAPKQPSTADAIINDGMGEFHVTVSSIRQRFLEAFRMRSEHASSIDGAARAALAARLVEEYGTQKGAADAVWALARENEWYREGEQSERYLLRGAEMTEVRNEAALDLTVAWHGGAIGRLSHDGFEWRWSPAVGDGPTLVRQTTPGKLPPFIVSLLPEGWLESVLKSRDERTALRSGKRYMSNITIVENRSELDNLPLDGLRTDLKRYVENGLFKGTYSGPGRSALEHSFENNLARIYAHADTPRLSGIQIKAPMFLDVDGVLSPAVAKPFTHILKPAGTSGFESLPIVEWLSLALGQSVGFEVPTNALVVMPDDMPAALLVERFDIRQNIDDERLLALEDMCSVLDLPTEAKYDGTMERIARAVQALSTAPRDDLLTLFKRALFSWFIADGDMHLKNMALLKIARPGDKRFATVRVAPLYDAVTTNVFPRLKNDRMALKLNGKDSNLHRADFLAFASTAGIRVGDAEAAIAEMAERLRQALEAVRLPNLPAHQDKAEEIAAMVIDLCKKRIQDFN